MRTRRGFITGAVALVSLLLIGTVGYSLIEGWSLFESFYMTIITLSTVGYSEVSPMSSSGRLFTSILILVGLGAVFYTVTAAFGYLVEQGFRGTLWRRRMEREISRLKDHYIVCGYGRVGEEVAEIIGSTRAPMVVIDIDPDAVERATKAGHLALQGNGSSDPILIKAGVRKARALVAAAATTPRCTSFRVHAARMPAQR
jgi:voltage-gated potassium channel